MKYTYRLMQDNLGVVRSDGAIIPADNANTDYKEYLEWVAEGNAPEDAD